MSCDGQGFGSFSVEDTILAGRSVASPKAPPTVLVESNATDHQEVSSFFREKKRSIEDLNRRPGA